jgi:hypothetical protein
MWMWMWVWMWMWTWDVDGDVGTGFAGFWVLGSGASMLSSRETAMATQNGERRTANRMKLGDEAS